MLTVLSWLAVCSAVAATNIFIADYAGSLTSASLTEQAGAYSLEKTFVNRDCAPNPSWLTIDPTHRLLFCLNEGLKTVNGSLSSFTISPDGSLQHVQNTTTISGPVSGVIYGQYNSNRGIALAHYTGSAVTSWLLEGGGKFEHNQNLPYTLPHPGPDAERQDAPHEHEAILDPTGQYLLVPDLGADLVRVFSWSPHSLDLKALAPLKAASGSGPRHAAFWNPYGVACEGCTTYFYLVAELASTITGYAVEYLPNGGGLAFTKVYNTTTFGKPQIPKGSAPAEVHVSVSIASTTQPSSTLTSYSPTTDTSWSPTVAISRLESQTHLHLSRCKMTDP